MSSVGGSKLTRLTDPGVGGDDHPGAYSPDNKPLVFARSGANGDSLGLFTIKTNGTGLRRITPPGTLIQSGNDGNWSPQGNQIVFSRHVGADVHGSIWVVNSDGSGLHEINVQALLAAVRASIRPASAATSRTRRPTAEAHLRRQLAAIRREHLHGQRGRKRPSPAHLRRSSNDRVRGTHPLVPQQATTGRRAPERAPNNRYDPDQDHPTPNPIGTLLAPCDCARGNVGWSYGRTPEQGPVGGVPATRLLDRDGNGRLSRLGRSRLDSRCARRAEPWEGQLY